MVLLPPSYKDYIIFYYFILFILYNFISSHLFNPDTDLRDIIMNFIIAGRDTTAQSLSWTFYRLSIHPEIQAKARKEVFSVLTASNTNTTIDRSAWISFDQLKEMRFLDALCKEVLRFHPSVPKEAKHAWKDDTLPDGTKIKAADLVIFCPWIMGRSESIWEDCQTFNPERFLGAYFICTLYCTSLTSRFHHFVYFSNLKIVQFFDI